MLKRIATGVVLAPLVVAAAWWGPAWIVHVILGVVVFGGLCEVVRLAPEGAGTRKDDALTVAVGIAAFVAWVVLYNRAFEIALAALLVFAVARTLSSQDHGPAVRRVAWDALSLLYVPGLLATASAVVGFSPPESKERAIFLLFLAVVWLGDTGAYFVGRSLGRHKLAPRLSPKKTIEGAVGGILGSVAGAWIIDSIFGVPGSALMLTAFAAAGGAVEQIGDLFQSRIKRAAGVKDSGNVFPGHGGVLDRIDGILFAAPLFWLYWHML